MGPHPGLGGDTGYFLDRQHPFYGQYASWLRDKEHAKGYHFGEPPCGSVAPAAVPFGIPLRWWSLDRPKRLATYLSWRDRRLEDILSIGTTSAGGPMRARGRAPASSAPEGPPQTPRRSPESPQQPDREPARGGGLDLAA